MDARTSMLSKVAIFCWCKISPRISRTLWSDLVVNDTQCKRIFRNILRLKWSARSSQVWSVEENFQSTLRWWYLDGFDFDLLNGDTIYVGLAHNCHIQMIGLNWSVGGWILPFYTRAKGELLGKKVHLLNRAGKGHLSHVTCVGALTAPCA